MEKYVFGPVASRRLGISLGVDIIPFKTCTLDCIYCECGAGTEITLRRDHFTDPAVVLAEIETVVKRSDHIDYITFSGSGEPTLNLDLGAIIDGIKVITDIPVALLTNGTLFHLKDVRDAVSRADLVLPSLDAVSPEVFAAVNRPHGALDVAVIIEGLVTFVRDFKGEVRLEVFIAKGVNDGPRELQLLHDVVKRIGPDRVQLNSLDRPPAHDSARPVEMRTLEAIAAQWQDLPVDIIKRIRKREEIHAFSKNLEHNILNTAARRPLTIEELEMLTGKKKAELFKYIDVLEREKKISPKIVDGKVFYVCV